MKIKFLIFGILFIFSSLYSQSNFKFDLKKNDPAKDSTQISDDKRLSIHQNFLADAIEAKDTLSTLYGLFYLYIDYYNAHDYESLQKMFEQSEILVANTGDASWKVAVKMRKAHLLELFDDDVQGALNEYVDIYDICTELGDSLCIAESLEQLGNLNEKLGNFSEANSYYLNAIELMEDISSKPELALTYHNYALMLSHIDKLSLAEQYYEKAIRLTQEYGNLLKETRYKSNLAYTYTRGGKFSKAIKLYHELIQINKENKWHSNLLLNYTGLADSYEKINNLEKTNEYTHAYYQLNDSLNDVKIKTEIQKLRFEMEVDKKELQNQKNIESLLITKRKNERLFWSLLLSVLSLISLGYFLLANRKKRKEEQNRNLEHLKNLRSVIEKKNAIITDQKQEIEGNSQTPVISPPIQPEEEIKMFELRMTSDEDISTFKIYFDKAYPNFLLKVRNKWATITPAEERMLMLIKMNITSKECSSILGISINSVKKSRYRLRKRLDLSEEVNMNDYVSNFDNYLFKNKYAS